jgi:hypothetical protein
LPSPNQKIKTLAAWGRGCAARIGDDVLDGAATNAGRLWYISAAQLATLPNLP